jgi:hypothetical protein
MDQTSAPAPQPAATSAPRSGCLKWGLVGCGILSAFLIVGLVLVGMKARSMMEWALVKMEDQTLAATTPDVTPEQRTAFQRAFAGFVEQAKQGKVSVDRMSSFRTKLMAAVADGKVTPDELRELTAAVEEPPPSPPPSR